MITMERAKIITIKKIFNNKIFKKVILMILKNKQIIKINNNQMGICVTLINNNNSLFNQIILIKIIRLFNKSINLKDQINTELHLHL
jgi:hypothetical protein